MADQAVVSGFGSSVALSTKTRSGVDFCVRRESVQFVQANTQFFKMADHFMPVGMVYG